MTTRVASANTMHRLLALAVILLCRCLGSAHAQGCISDEAALEKSFTAGQNAGLCPNTTINLTKPIIFNNDNQAIYTVGYPTDGSRARIGIATASYVSPLDGKSYPFQSAIEVSLTRQLSGISVRNVQVYGNAGQLGMTPNGDGDPAGCDTSLTSCGALVDIGDAVSFTIDSDVIHTSRTRSHLHLHPVGGACNSGTVSNNDIGYAVAYGTDPEWQVSDAILVECNLTSIINNSITDATDGGIVVFPRSYNSVTVSGNTITSSSNDMGLGIGLVDYGDGQGDQNNTQVYNNTLVAQGSGEMFLGIASGTNLYTNNPTGPIFGANVHDNLFVGSSIAFALPVSGATDFSFSNNDLDDGNLGLIDESTSPDDNGITEQFISMPNGSLNRLIFDAEFIQAHYKYLLGSRNPSSGAFLNWLYQVYDQLGEDGANCNKDSLYAFTKSFIEDPGPISYLGQLSSQQIASNLIWMILDRTPDQGTVNTYATVIDQASDKVSGALQVAYIFYTSQEYANLLQQYGCIPIRMNPGP